MLFSAQPARSGREWWLGASVDLAIEMISCCHCLRPIFTDDVWWGFVVGVLVIDAASFSKSNGASTRVALHIDDLHLCLAKWLGRVGPWNCQQPPSRLVCNFCSRRK